MEFYSINALEEQSNILSFTHIFGHPVDIDKILKVCKNID